ncbi:formyltransferase family protein [uncultured Roseivirga sp.]|uniref:formyltransferase family protein n=1 Tax=uncultured Roseivirga sp. TaxID=543088 RepID=UPI0030D6F67B|tara:strand:- start:131054 stop:131815 length:762 start_codon:yes stop_codon:yes gene_type:complete
MRIIPFADHKIGYDCVEYLLHLEGIGKVEIPFLVTTSNNENNWWPSLASLASEKSILIFEPGKPIDDFIFDDIDFVFLISWKYLMPKSFVNHYDVIINLHYSLLPKFRGVYPVNWAIIEGEEKTGVTFHSINNCIDRGHLLAQREVDIVENDTSYSLLQKLDIIAFDLFQAIITEQILSGNICFINVLPDESAYYSRIKFNEKAKLSLQDNMKIGDILNILRGYTFKDGTSSAYFIGRNGKKYWVSIDIKSDE